MRFIGVKKLLLAMALPVAAFMGCSDDDDTGLPSLGIEGGISSLELAQTGESRTFNIESNREWTITKPDNAAWLTVVPMVGYGSQTVTVSAEANAGSTRSAQLTVSMVENPDRFVSLTVTQKGTESSTALYTENCGTDVEKNAEGYWPYVDQFTGWQRGGDLDQSGVTYTGSGASVRNSGNSYQPASGVDASGAPYVYMAKATDYFVINGINVTGNTQLTFTFTALYQSNYEGGPVFSPVASSTLKVYAGYDGVNWAEVQFTTDGNTGWSVCSTQFAIESGQNQVYIKFADFVSGNNAQLRLDDFNMYAGGNGALINPGTGPGPGPGDYITVKQLRDKYTGSDTPITDDIAVKASVISDPAGGNSTSLKNVIISDGEAGIMMRLAEDAAANLVFGTEVGVSLKGVTLTEYSGLLQINNVPNANVTVLGTKTVQPTSITTAQLLSGDYESMLVSVQDVQFVDPTGNIGSADSHTSTEVESRQGQKFMVFVSKYSTFVSTPVPSGSGPLVGIGSINNGTYQILPNNAQAFAGMTNPRFDVSDDHFYLDGTQTSMTITAAAGGGEYAVNVHSTVAWTVSTTNSQMISFTPASGSNDGVIAVTVPANGTGAARSGELKISTTSSLVSPQTLTVTFNQSAQGGGGGGTYMRVTSTADVVAGGKYIFAMNENAVFGNAIQGGYPTGKIDVVTDLGQYYNASSDSFESNSTVDAYAYETASATTGLSLHNATMGYLAYNGSSTNFKTGTSVEDNKYMWNVIAGSDGLLSFRNVFSESQSTKRVILFQDYVDDQGVPKPRFGAYAESNMTADTYSALRIYRLAQ